MATAPSPSPPSPCTVEAEDSPSPSAPTRASAAHSPPFSSHEHAAAGLYHGHSHSHSHTSRPLCVHAGEPTASAFSGKGSFDLTPINWERYFDQRRMVHIPPHVATLPPQPAAVSNEFCVYTAGPPSPSPSAPSSALSSAPPPFLVVLLHGGGHTSLAWACVASYLKHSMAVLSFDLRGHGSTHTSDDADLSMPRLVLDVIDVVTAVYPRPPPLLLVGHSLGGALAVHVTATKKLPVAALVVVDLVEGSAVSSLSHMSAVVESRPSLFPSPQAAVQWTLYAGAMRNPESARVSVPDQLVLVGSERDRMYNSKKGEAGERKDESAAATTTAASLSSSAATAQVDASSSSSSPSYRWRTDLLASEPYWSDWFTGLSNLFLSSPLPKLLMLAGSDRLDTPMMIAQMQGKLQLDVIGNAGHSVQEDQPREVARKLAEFAARHKLSAMGSVWAQKGGWTGANAAATHTPSASPSSSTSSSSSHSKPPVPLFHQ